MWLLGANQRLGQSLCATGKFPFCFFFASFPFLDFSEAELWPREFRKFAHNLMDGGWTSTITKHFKIPWNVYFRSVVSLMWSISWLKANWSMSFHPQYSWHHVASRSVLRLPSRHWRFWSWALGIHSCHSAKPVSTRPCDVSVGCIPSSFPESLSASSASTCCWLLGGLALRTCCSEHQCVKYGCNGSFETNASYLRVLFWSHSWVIATFWWHPNSYEIHRNLWYSGWS